MQSRPPPGHGLKITVLSHRRQRAQQLVQALQEAVQSKPGADPSALLWQVGSEAQAAIGSDVCLLLPWEDRDTPETTLQDLQAHQSLRQTLHERGLPFEALRGGLPRLMHQALSALSRWQPALKPEGAQTLARPGWRSVCENCDDPDCEFRLLKTAARPVPDGSLGQMTGGLEPPVQPGPMPY